MSLPCAPASRRKHGEMPAYWIGRLLGVERVVAVHADERHLARADEEELVGGDGVRLLATEREEPGARSSRAPSPSPAADTSFSPRSTRVSTARRRTAISRSAPSPTSAYERPPANLRGPSQSTSPSAVMSSTWSFGCEVELARRAHLADLDVVLLALADGHLGPRDARDAEHEVLEARLHLGRASARAARCRCGPASPPRRASAARPCWPSGSAPRARSCARASARASSSPRGAPCRRRGARRGRGRSRLFVMAARTWSAFWRMNWMSSMTYPRGRAL